MMMMRWIPSNQTIDIFRCCKLQALLSESEPDLQWIVRMRGEGERSDDEMMRWRDDGVMGWWGDGVMGWWGDGVMGWWGDGVMGWWGDEVMGWWGDGVEVLCGDYGVIRLDLMCWDIVRENKRKVRWESYCVLASPLPRWCRLFFCCFLSCRPVVIDTSQQGGVEVIVAQGKWAPAHHQEYLFKHLHHHSQACISSHAHHAVPPKVENEVMQRW